MTPLFRTLPADVRRELRPLPFPSWVEPMLATLTDQRFSAETWIYEPKFDGERCMAFKNRNIVSLYSRNRVLLNGAYPELVDAIRRQPIRDFVIDGEIVAFDGAVTSFARLQRRMHASVPDKKLRSEVPIFFYAFDIPYLSGNNLTRLSLVDRKQILEKSLNFKGALRFASHRRKAGEILLKAACRSGWEGLVAKRADSKYVSGRSSDWLKFKCLSAQEFVIGGYSDPRGGQVDFGALLVGTYENKRLLYAGKVGTGFDMEMLVRLGRRLRDVETGQCPFADPRLIPKRGVHWTEPVLVAQIGFTDWTGEGRLRHGRFLGLRTDKNPRDVVREMAR